MRIRNDTWHAELYRQAYVENRAWIDPFSYEPSHPTADEVAEIAGYEAARKAYEAKRPKELTGLDRKNLAEAKVRCRTAVSVWHETKFQHYTQERRQAVLNRLQQNRLSICPYFWAVVLASLVYWPLSKVGDGLKRADQVCVNILTRARKPLVVLSILVLTGVLGYAVYDNIRNGQVERPANLWAEWENWQLERRAEAEEEQRLKAEKQERARQQEAWTRTHPAAKESEAGHRLVDILGRSLVMLARLLMILIVPFIATLVIYLIIKKVWGRISRITRRRPRATSAGGWLHRLKTFLHDTRDLIMAFVKAKKERVCPYIEFVNGPSGPSDVN